MKVSREARIVFGFHTVLARLRADPSSVLEIFLDEARQDARARDLAAAAERAGVRLMRVPAKRLDGFYGGGRHQGVVARVTMKRAGESLEEILEVIEKPMVLVLDGVTDPHNLGACLRVANAAGSGLGMPGAVEAFVECCEWTPPDRLEAHGWVTDRVSGRLPVEVRALVGGEVLARCGAFSPRPDVAASFPVERVEAVAWRLELRLPSDPPDLSARLRIEAVDPDGRAATICESSVHEAVLRSCRLQLFMTHQANRRLEAELQRTVDGYEGRLTTLRQETQGRIGDLEARIAAMRASFFWRLRDRWFALKRWLRLTRES